MEFRILGPLEVEDAGQLVPLGGAKQRALLALLLITSNRRVSVDGRVGARWGGEPPTSAANALQYHVSRLRKTLGDGAPIVTREPGYLIQVGPDQLDLLHFERLVVEADGADAARAGRL